MSRTVLAVHGVNKQDAGRITESVTNSLGEVGCDTDVVVFDWSRIDPVGVDEGGFLDPASVQEGTRVLAGAAFQGFEAPVDATPWRFDTLRKLLRALLITIDATILLTATMFVAAPIIALLAVPSYWLFGVDLPLQSAWVLGLLPTSAALSALLSAVVLSTALIVSMLQRRSEPVRVATRGLALLFARYLLPILGLLVSSTIVYAAIVAFFAFGTAFAVVINQGILAVSDTPFSAFDEAALATIMIASALVAAGLLLLLAGRGLVAPAEVVLKVLLDIFRYVADPDHRRKVQRGLDEQLTALRDHGAMGGEIAIGAHSLGSVIIVHSLLRSPAWRPDDRIVLATFGSPLTRLILRFFPRLLMPPRVGQIDREIRRRVASFRWVNVYRPRDPIGASLQLEREAAGVDRSTGQKDIELLRAHNDYWSDVEVARAIVAALERKTELPAEAQLPAEEEPLPGPFFDPEEAPRLHTETTGWLLRGAIVAALVIIATGTAVQRIRVEHAGITERRQERVVFESPDPATVRMDPAAQVVYWLVFRQGGGQGGTSTSECFRVRYQVAGREYDRIYPPPHRPFDADRLRDAVTARGDCRADNVRPLITSPANNQSDGRLHCDHQEAWRQADRLCVASLPVWYRVDNPTRIYLGDEFERRDSTIGRWAGYGWRFAEVLPFFLLIGIVLHQFIGTWVNMLTGAAPERGRHGKGSSPARPRTVT